jgi:hypothetical protein
MSYFCNATVFIDKKVTVYYSGVMKLENLEDLTVGVMYVVDFHVTGKDIILKESSGCVLLAIKPIGRPVYRMSRVEYTFLGDDKSKYTIRELTDAEEEDLFMEFL